MLYPYFANIETLVLCIFRLHNEVVKMRVRKGLMRLFVSSLLVSSFTGLTVIERADAAVHTYNTTVKSDHSGRMVAIVDMPAGTVDVGTVNTGSGAVVMQSYNKGTRQLTLTLENSSNTYVKETTYGGVTGIETKTKSCPSGVCSGTLLFGWSTSFISSIKYAEVKITYSDGVTTAWKQAYYYPNYSDYGIDYTLSNDTWKMEAQFRAYTTETIVYGYQYPLSIQYSNNNAPVLSVDQTSTIYSNKTAVDIRGKVSDVESNSSTVTVTVGGKSASGTVGGSTSPVGWLLSPILPEGRFSGGYVIAQDWESFAPIVYLPEIIVDRTKPTAPKIGVTL